MEPKAVTVQQMRVMLATVGVSVSKKAVIEWLTRGTLKGVKIGSRWYIPMAEVERLIRPLRAPAEETEGGSAV